MCTVPRVNGLYGTTGFYSDSACSDLMMWQLVNYGLLGAECEPFDCVYVNDGEYSALECAEDYDIPKGEGFFLACLNISN